MAYILVRYMTNDVEFQCTSLFLVRIRLQNNKFTRNSLSCYLLTRILVIVLKLQRCDFEV